MQLRQRPTSRAAGGVGKAVVLVQLAAKAVEDGGGNVDDCGTVLAHQVVVDGADQVVASRSLPNAHLVDHPQLLQDVEERWTVAAQTSGCVAWTPAVSASALR